MPYSNMQLAEAFIKAGELADALEALNQQISTDPRDSEALRLKVQVSLRVGTEGALHDALLAQAALDHLTPEDCYLSSVIHERLTDLPTALLWAQQAESTSTEDAFRARAIERQLLLLQAMSDPLRALAVAERADMAQWAGDLALQLGQYRDAVVHYIEALERMIGLEARVSPAVAANIRGRVIAKRASAYAALGDLHTAERDYADALALIPNDPLIAVQLGGLMGARGDLEGGEAKIKAALDGASDGLKQLMMEELRGDDRYRHLTL
ncbi:MAG: hypothetical protein ACOYL5_06600 [Phototrophicaceae bacterium]